MRTPPPLRLLVVLSLPACGSLTYYSDTTPPTDSGVQDTEIEDSSAPDTPPEDCATPEDCSDPDCAALCDADQDGAVSPAMGGDDCDDADGTVHPGAPEICDQRDNDCDQVIDGDSDGDGAALCEDCDDSDPTRYPEAADVCGDGIDSDCDAIDCLVWTEGFEGGALALPWVGGGALPWVVGSTSVFQGAYSASSGDITHHGLSELFLTATFPAGGKLSFWHMGSSEYTWDWFWLEIDGVEVGAWTGEWAWQYATFDLSPGAHTLRWVYSKDYDIDGGLDTAWLDEVVLEGGSP